MRSVSWAACAFGVTLALVVGARANAQSLAVGMGILIGMVAMLPLTAGLLLTLAAYRPPRGRVVEGRGRVVGQGAVLALSALRAPDRAASSRSRSLTRRRRRAMRAVPTAAEHRSYD